MFIPLTLDTAPLDVPLWAVYGSDCFPTVFACIVKDYPGSPGTGRALWGWSIYRNKGAFRTLGVGIEWCEKHNVRIFRSRQEAFDYIASLFPQEGNA
ncbi:hypothetical protein CcrColossus_gp382 [Caulobacter phage CcrColossus]|uniref:Uncharacterized protein n=1 Tax=Caulobacter phage CcrColossus TaxID=1211640 RepID=K4K6P3_9CAUD|nr:hypothetical protein CcrColossus_gp382 [Caulobacter phage CcrColossus]AFU88252.1 hypothetical protein CcrColossus_gp382 [Caulobacter phage CcrColossus]